MKKVNIYLADGFEEIEAVTVIDVLRRAGIDAKTVSVTRKKEVKGAHNIVMTADAIFEEIDNQEADAMVLPGGMPGTKNLDAHIGLKNLLIRFAGTNKLVTAICAAPSVLGKLGLLNGRRATCYPGFEQYLGGTIVKDEAVVQDDSFITSRGPGTAFPFALMLVEVLVGAEEANRLREAMLVPENY